MNAPRRNKCRSCGALIAQGKSYCVKCEILEGTGHTSMATGLKHMQESAAGHLAEMEERRGKIFEGVDSSLQERAMDKRAIDGLEVSGKGPSPFASHDTDVGVKNPSTFAGIEKLCSEIRHSIVEACFYNLKLQAQMLPEKAGSTGFMEEFWRNTGQLPMVVKRVRAFFDEEVEAHLKISHIFGKEHAKALKGLQRLEDSLPTDKETPNRFAGVSEELTGAIDDIVSALEAIDVRIRKNRIDVRELVKNIAAVSKERCDEAGIELSIRLSEEPLPKIYTAGTILHDSIVEIIRNSIKHAFASAAPSKKQIEISAYSGESSDLSVIIEVSDNGIGLAEEILQRARTAQNPTGKSGFGLPMVMHNIENLHKGSVRCRNNHGEGSTFFLSIPS